MSICYQAEIDCQSNTVFVPSALKNTNCVGSHSTNGLPELCQIFHSASVLPMVSNIVDSSDGTEVIILFINDSSCLLSFVRFARGISESFWHASMPCIGLPSRSTTMHEYGDVTSVMVPGPCHLLQYLQPLYSTWISGQCYTQILVLACLTFVLSPA